MIQGRNADQVNSFIQHENNTITAIASLRSQRKRNTRKGREE
jgi:hypothetical protein